MAGKEATIYIVDLGKSMSEKRHGRDVTDLDWALEYVWDKITSTVSRRSFGDLVRVMT
jgi:ATP-dependent DNA helicase 2 subunit 2